MIRRQTAPQGGGGRRQGRRPAAALTGSGEVTLSAPVEEVWRRLGMNELAAIVPAAAALTQDGPDRYSAEVVIGVAGIRGSYRAQIEMRDKKEAPSASSERLRVHWARVGSGFVTLNPRPAVRAGSRIATRSTWRQGRRGSVSACSAA
jgi:hypothetical protein